MCCLEVENENIEKKKTSMCERMCARRTLSRDYAAAICTSTSSCVIHALFNLLHFLRPSLSLSFFFYRLLPVIFVMLLFEVVESIFMFRIDD